jgi:hypothetical protein
MEYAEGKLERKREKKRKWKEEALNVGEEVRDQAKRNEKKKEGKEGNKYAPSGRHLLCVSSFFFSLPAHPFLSVFPSPFLSTCFIIGPLFARGARPV